MGRIEEIKERHLRHKKLIQFARSPAADISSNKELDILVFETKHIVDKVPDDIEYLLSRLQIAEEALQQISRADDSSLIEYPRAMINIADEALEQIHKGE